MNPITDPHLTPHWATSALLTIDVQRDFLSESPYGIPGTTEVLPQVARLAEAFRGAGRPIVHLIRLYDPSGEDADLVRRTLLSQGAKIVLPGSEGSEIAGELLPPGAPPLKADLLLSGEPQTLGEREVALYKPRWGGFYRTRLDELLRGWDVDTLVVAGCNFPNCPRATLIEGSERDYRLVLADDATSRIHDAGRTEVAGIGVNVLAVQTITDALKGETA